MYTANTQRVRVHRDAPQADLIAQAAEVIRRGGLVAFPTETVYGLGANALDRKAIGRIFSAKQRPAHDPVIAHISRVEQLAQLAVNVPEMAYRLASRYWAGPLTMVLERAPSVPDNIASGLPTIAVRMPSHPVARALIESAGVPIAAPSANTFTRPSSTQADHVWEDLHGHVDLILDGGEANIGIESTVIDMTQQPPIILRPGGVLLEDLRRVVPEVQTMTPDQIPDDETPSSSPGMMSKHYSPRADLILFDGERNATLNAMHTHATELAAKHRRVGILTTSEEAAFFTNTGARIISMGSRNDIAQIAHVLFGAMRALDAQNVEQILVRSYGHEGLGVAIYDRLLRAAEGKVVKVS
jgi:L-threonylcarbamoyladenylate synthase